MRSFEESVEFLGTWGPFQRRIMILLSITVIPCGYNILSIIFLLAVPPHHCHIPIHSNLTPEWIQASIPIQEQIPVHPESSTCRRYELGLVQNFSAHGIRPQLEPVYNVSVQGSGQEVPLSSLKQESCKDGWIYSTEYYHSTAATEFNLVCEDQWKQPLTSLVYILGALCGCLLSGPMSDRFGRKPVLFSSNALLSIFSAALAFAPSWPVFTALFFMMGLGQISGFIIVFVLGSEILVGRTRVFFSGLCLPFFYITSMMMMPCSAYLVRNWRHLSLIMAVPGLACIPLWWAIPESPRWLLFRGRTLEAELLLKSAALENHVEAPHVIFLSEDAEKAPRQNEKSGTFFDLLRTRNIRNIMILLWLTWFAQSVSLFGFSFNTSSLQGSPFLNYFLVTAVELPAYTVSWLAARGLPRRLSFICFNLLGALAVFLVQVTMHSHPAITFALVLLGKFGILAGISLLYMITGELSPTAIRSTALSSGATFSRVGFAVSPYLLQLAVINQALPWIVVAALSLLSAAICFFLPETFRHPLPDTIQEMSYSVGFSWLWTSKRPRKYDGKSSPDQTTKSEIICTTQM